MPGRCDGGSQVLHRWSKENFGKVTSELEELRVQLEVLKAGLHSRAEERVVTDKMDELLYREEMMWLQRSRITWLKEGDRNMSYFHRQVVWRARKNKIRRLKISIGSWVENLEEMQKMAMDHFKHLYQDDSGVSPTFLLGLIE
jgi:hypothetical protein